MRARVIIMGKNISLINIGILKLPSANYTINTKLYPLSTVHIVKKGGGMLKIASTQNKHEMSSHLYFDKIHSPAN